MNRKINNNLIDNWELINSRCNNFKGEFSIIIKQQIERGE